MPVAATTCDQIPTKLTDIPISFRCILYSSMLTRLIVYFTIINIMLH